MSARPGPCGGQPANGCPYRDRQLLQKVESERLSPGSASACKTLRSNTTSSEFKHLSVLPESGLHWVEMSVRYVIAGHFKEYYDSE
jgi:hypothetical protein